jgi:hypothetical protein
LVQCRTHGCDYSFIIFINSLQRDLDRVPNE